MTLSAVAYLEKNKLSSSGSWIILFELTAPDSTVIRLCKNVEDVVWPVTGGNTYTAFPFEFDEIGDTSKNEVPRVVIRVGNVTRAIQAYLENKEGLVDSEVIIRVVHSTHVTTANLGVGVHNPDPEIELNYTVQSTSSNVAWATFILGAMNPYKRMFPRNTVERGFCRYRIFKGSRCQYAGVETSCDRTLSTCRSYGNSIHFGGAPGVDQKGIYV